MIGLNEAARFYSSKNLANKECVQIQIKNHLGKK